MLIVGSNLGLVWHGSCYQLGVEHLSLYTKYESLLNHTWLKTFCCTTLSRVETLTGKII